MTKDPVSVSAMTQTMIKTLQSKIKEQEENVVKFRKRRIESGKVPVGKRLKGPQREIEIVDMTKLMDDEELSQYAEEASRKDRDLRYFRWEVPTKLAPDLSPQDDITYPDWPPNDVEKAEPMEVVSAYYKKYSELALKQQKLRVYVETGDRSKKSKSKQDTNKVRLRHYCLCTADAFLCMIKF